MARRRVENENSMKAAERQRLAGELRLGGMSYEQIAQRLGYASHSGAHKAVDSWLRKYQIEPAQELILLESARLDRMFCTLWTPALQGDLEAMALAIRISERRSKLLGLDGAFREDVEPFIRKFAELNGYDPDWAVEVAQGVVKQIAKL